MDKGDLEEEEELEGEALDLKVREATDPLEAALTLYPVTITGGTESEFRRNIMWEVCHKARRGNRPSEC